MHFAASLVKTYTESDRGNFDLMGKLFSLELPLKSSSWVVLRMSFFEKTNCSIQIAACKVLAIISDNQLSDWVSLWLLRSLQRSVQLFKFTGLRIHDFDFTIVLSY